MATECPECGKYFKAKNCWCGYSPPVNRPFFKPQQLPPGVPMPQHTRDMQSKFKFSEPSRAWATNIIDKYEAGAYEHYYAYELACQAVNHEAVEPIAEAF